MFKSGQHYSRTEIHKAVGGSTEKYLPHVRSSVVCGCFKPNLNPSAPAEILPGNSADIMKWAWVFAKQRDPIPIFLKRDTNRWEYVGHWRVCASPITDPQAIAEADNRADRSDISMILKLEPIAR